MGTVEGPARGGRAAQPHCAGAPRRPAAGFWRAATMYSDADDLLEPVALPPSNAITVYILLSRIK